MVAAEASGHDLPKLASVDAGQVIKRRNSGSAAVAPVDELSRHLIDQAPVNATQPDELSAAPVAAITLYRESFI